MSIPFVDDATAVVYSLIVHVAGALAPAGGVATAIVLCTVALRALLLPLTLAAVRGERSRAVLAPKVRELQQRHGQDRARLGTELTELYRAEGVSPLAGCLPALVQAPFFMITYRMFSAARIAGHANVLLTHQLFGVALSTRLIGGGHPLVFVPFVVVLVGLGILADRRARRVAAANATAVPNGIMRVLPYLSVASLLVVPLAAALYLVTTMSWTAVENAVLRRGLPAGGA
ncbi:membrane protein insertase YidC [Rugosimonospora africana]|uniref:Membrane protein insertase YidC n=1 Tax=Rugosimonospora africana TaxID=556532 RepID=A0A8J3QLD5_9ACTN|nr:membrane protein insertase YidC [Rugosimonospora africana]GIH11959.1 membrane protein [Rugosimonospora africana]